MLKKSSKVKIKVFVAHSFDKNKLEGEKYSDIELAKWFITLIKKRLGFDVVTGHKPSPVKIDDKIIAEIADCNCVIGIFSKRYFINNQHNKFFPSLFVLCECACSMGIY